MDVFVNGRKYTGARKENSLKSIEVGFGTVFTVVGKPGRIDIIIDVGVGDYFKITQPYFQFSI